MPEKVGFLYSGSQNSLGRQFTKFKNALPGGITLLPTGAADDDYQRKLPDAADRLINVENVKVLVAAGGPVSAFAARDATAKQTGPKTPVVFTSVTDPVGSGLYVVRGNLTGIAGMTTEMDAARLRLLQELKPSISTVGVLRNPNRPNVDGQWNNLNQGRDKRLTLSPVDVGVKGTPGTPQQIKDAFQNLPSVEALLVTADPFFNSRRPDVIREVAQKTIPAIYQWREFVEEGGLMSFGPSLDEEYSAAANYVGRILAGERPPNMPPLYQPTKFELVINLNTAKALNLAVPQTLLDRAEVI